MEESRWHAFRFDEAALEAQILLEVLTLPEAGPEPEDRRRILTLHDIGRIVVRLRIGRWNSWRRKIVPVVLGELSDVVRSFGASDIYGLDFIDPPEDVWPLRDRKTSLDQTFPDGSQAHELFLFKGDTSSRGLDLTMWFRDLSIRDCDGREIPAEEFIAGGRRWWAANNRRDPRTMSHGIIPIPPPD